MCFLSPSVKGAGRAVCSVFQDGTQINVNSRLSVQHCLSNFLLNYCSAPYATTGVSPSSLFLHHHIQTRLDLFCPDYSSQVLSKQAQQKVQHD